MVEEDAENSKKRKCVVMLHSLTTSSIYYQPNLWSICEYVWRVCWWTSNQAHLHATGAFDSSFSNCRASLSLLSFLIHGYFNTGEETGKGERSGWERTRSQVSQGTAGGGEARRRPNSNFGRRLIFAQTMGKRIFPRGPFRLSTAWCSFYLLPPYTGSRPSENSTRMYVCVGMGECVYVTRGPCTWSPGHHCLSSSLCRRCPPSPLLLQCAGMCVSRHVCCLTYDASFHCPV